ncbi:hypothetical protein Tco_0266573 [Tanacetum coccineum]
MQNQPLEPKKKDSTSGSSKGTKSQPKSFGKSIQSEEPVFELDWENPEGDDYPFNLSKPLPLILLGNPKYDLPGIEDMVPNHMESCLSCLCIDMRMGDISTLETTNVSPSMHIKRHAIQERYVYSTKAFYSGCLSCQGLTKSIMANVADACTSFSLRMFTKCLVIQKRVEDLSTWKLKGTNKINFTKPDTTKTLSFEQTSLLGRFL